MVAIFIFSFSGWLLSAAFAPIDQWWCAPLALAIFLARLVRSDKPYLHTFVFAFTFNAFLLHWTSTYVGSLPWFILAFALSIFYLPLAIVRKWGIATFPFLYFVLEEVRNHFPFGGFGWARLAYSQADAPYARLASMGGSWLLSAMVLLLATALLYLLSKRSLPVLLALLPILLMFYSPNPHIIGYTRALLVQGNVPTYGLDFNSRARAVFEYHIAETERALKTQSQALDFMLWPENSVDVDPFTNTEVANKLNQIVNESKVPLIIGAVVGDSPKRFNQSILWRPDSKIAYSKKHLAPFGEYIPLRALARIVSPFVDNVVDFAPGTEDVVFSIGRAKVVPIICFELLDDQLMASGARRSNILVVQTNNATFFGASVQPNQQLSITRIRAIEHQRTILTVSTTGKSAHISYDGKIIASTETQSNAHLWVRGALIDSESPRDKLGNRAFFGVLIWLALYASAFRRSVLLRR